MPSPTLITVPTSITVTPASKFSICWRMISLISFALIGSMSHFRFAIASCRFESVFNRRSKGNWQCLSRHPFLYQLQLISHRAVVYGRADARHQSADEIGILLEIQPHFFLRHGSQPLRQTLLDTPGPRPRRRDDRRDHSRALVEDSRQSLINFRQFRQPLVL